MALSIANAVLLVTSVCECMNEVTHAPLLILTLFEEFNPLVRHSHGHPIVKTNTSFEYLSAERGLKYYVVFTYPETSSAIVTASE